MAVRKQESPNAPATPRSLEGIMWQLVSIACFAVMQIILKRLFLFSIITPLETTYIRCIWQLILTCTFAQYCDVSIITLPREQGLPMGIRSFSGMLGVTIFAVSTLLFPLSLISTLNYLTPLITALLSFLFLKETITYIDVGGMILAFGGVLLIIFNPYKAGSTHHGQIVWYWYIAPISSPVIASVSTIMLRYMGKAVHCSVAPAFQAAVTAAYIPIVGLVQLSLRERLTEYSWEVMAYLFVIGMTGGIGQITLTKALQLEKAGRVQAFSYLNVVLMLGADLLLFGVPIHWLDYLAMAIIIGSSMMITLLKSCQLVI